MDGGYVKGDGGNRGGDGNPRSRAIAVVNSSFIHKLTRGGSIYVHRQKFSSVTVVGIVEDYSETTTKVEFKLRDGEGAPVKVLKWKTNQNVDGDGPYDFDGSLVRVFGNPRQGANNPEPHLIAYQIIPIKDLNELIMHHVEVVASSLVLNKRKNNVIAGLPAVSGFSNKSGQRQVGNQGKTPSRNQIQPQQEVAVSMPGMKPNDAIVLKAITACSDVAGIPKDVLFRTLHSMSQPAIMTSLDFLLTEGHIYTTTDDDHFKSTDG